MNDFIDKLKKDIFEELVGNIQQVIQHELNKLQNAFNKPKDEEMFYDLERVSEMLNISVSTMYALNARKEIAYSKFAGKCYYSQKDIIEALKHNRIKTKFEIQNQAEQLLLPIKSRNNAR
ncbi:helix-turn-helix domain-containing protein [Elizabethkingia sp. HX XZB]|uniref:helix-turn-helix domain-containing protein n=1 Tax=Elizabethkingia sp. HX XZB TaxID=3003193 RepID=UPI002A24E5FD|nr:helix-turn-helix domain-containing protein [Elizabethkingia sp. HX XZB]MDX8567365.1 helix-turn-helix domain-containing protein [Elizabethkingia sp. HX XZB]